MEPPVDVVGFATQASKQLELALLRAAERPGRYLIVQVWDSKGAETNDHEFVDSFYITEVNLADYIRTPFFSTADKRYPLTPS